MLTRLSPHSLPLRNLRAEHGVSLMEVLVAMVAATVVTAATVTVLQVAYNQQTRTTDHTQANQIARTAMNSIVTELNSSCTGLAPIQSPKSSEISTLGLAPTNTLNLWLISVYGEKGSGDAVLKSAVKHDINWTETGTSNTKEKLGTLTDYEFASKSGEEPETWKFPLEKANMKKKLLAENVIPFEVEKKSAIFEYSDYENGVLKQVPLTSLPFSSEAAEKVSKVEIGFTQAPEDGDTREGHTVKLSDAVNLRLDPSESASEGPCE